MNEGRSGHASVSMGNKMFVIGGLEKCTCEMFHFYCYIKTC